MTETPEVIFKKLCKEIEIEFIGSKVDSEEKKQSMAKIDK